MSGGLTETLTQSAHCEGSGVCPIRPAGCGSDRRADKPSVGDKDVLVRVHATTVNRTDCGYRAAKPFVIRAVSGPLRPRRKILGTEFAGVAEAVGADVTSFAVCDRAAGRSCGTWQN
ncbi:alcohol dehydrogenase catalytic domain-containing protein [Spirillospora sp. NPDC127506]